MTAPPSLPRPGSGPRPHPAWHRVALVIALTLVLACRAAPTSPDDAPQVRDRRDDATPEPGVADEAPTTGSSTTTTAPPPVEVTLAFGGDLLTHMPLVAAAGRYGATTGQPYDFGPMFAPLAPVIGDVDLALCHLEVPLVGDGQEITGYPSFHAPRELAGAVDASGYDGCSTASNHSLDGGLPAITATLDTFDGLGLGHVGTARSAEEDLRPRLYDVAGARIAHLSYSYGFNGYPLPPDAPWAADLIDPARIEADAAAARAAGAQLVVVSVHWGTEYQSDPDGAQQELAGRLAFMADVDLVIGHHAHVVQPVERIGDTWVVFGLGNQLSNQSQPERRDGLTAVVTVGGPAGGPLDVRSIEAVPTWVDLATYEVLPAAETLGRAELPPALRTELEGSIARTMEVVNRRGAAIPVRAWS